MRNKYTGQTYGLRVIFYSYLSSVLVLLFFAVYPALKINNIRETTKSHLLSSSF